MTNKTKQTRIPKCPLQAYNLGKQEAKKELDDLQEAYDILLKEIVRLRKILDYV